MGPPDFALSKESISNAGIVSYNISLTSYSKMRVDLAAQVSARVFHQHLAM